MPLDHSLATEALIARSLREARRAARQDPYSPTAPDRSSARRRPSWAELVRPGRATNA